MGQHLGGGNQALTEVAVLRVEVEAGEDDQQAAPVDLGDDKEEVEAELQEELEVERLLKGEELGLLELHPRLLDVVGIPQREEVGY
jgi:hypothetical protein